MNEKLPTPIEDNVWQAEIERAKIEREQKEVVPVANERQSLFKLLAKGVLIGVLALVLLGAWVYADHALLPFDAQAWRAKIGREKQGSRLFRQVKLVGMTSSSVQKLLGQPDKTQNNNWIYIFRTDKVKSSVIQYSILVVFQNGRVSSSALKSESLLAVY